MDLTSDVRRAVPGLIGLALGRGDAVDAFNLSIEAFWRVFWLVLGGMLAAEVGFHALVSRDSADMAYQGALIALSVMGGSTLAVQVLLAMGALENWDHRILGFLIPALWSGAALWAALTVWRVMAFGLGVSGDIDLTARILLSLVALYTAWQAARHGLGLSSGAAFGVLLVAACAEWGCFTLINMSLLFNVE